MVDRQGVRRKQCSAGSYAKKLALDARQDRDLVTNGGEEGDFVREAQVCGVWCIAKEERKAEEG
jgi:hypothetical protein